jgi:BetI-type transcriptional repressor, C-terminal
VSWAAAWTSRRPTHRLAALIDGLSVEAVLYPPRAPPGRQVALLDQLLHDFSAPPLHPARTLTE